MRRRSAEELALSRTPLLQARSSPQLRTSSIMRFKARLRVERASEWQRLLGVLARLDHTAVLHLTPPEEDRVEWIVLSRAAVMDLSGSRGGGAWVAMERDAWFGGYRIESRSGHHIALEMDLGNVLRALHSVVGAHEAQVRLAKKGVPVLTVEIRTADHGHDHDGGAPTWDVVQHVPVSVMDAGRLQELREPETEAGVYGVVMPLPARLSAAVDRMRPFAYATGQASEVRAVRLVMERSPHQPAEATFHIGVHNEALEVQASYLRLKVATVDEPTQAARNASHVGDGVVAGGDVERENAPDVRNATSTPPRSNTLRREAVVDARELARVLQAHTVFSSQVFCFLFQACALFHFSSDDLEASYYLPLRESA